MHNMILHIQYCAILILDSTSGVWSQWSNFSPCSSDCRKIRQRFCSSKNRAVDCPKANTYGIQNEVMRCSDKECYGTFELYNSVVLNNLIPLLYPNVWSTCTFSHIRLN